MTLYDSYFETICDDVASKTVTFTGCEKSHLMCNVALIHFPSAKSTQVRKIWKGDANLNLLKKFHKQKSPLRRRYLRRPMAVLFHSKTLSSSNGRQPQLRSSNFPLGIFSVPCCPNDNKKERIGLAESREIERTYIEHIKCCGTICLLLHLLMMKNLLPPGAKFQCWSSSVEPCFASNPLTKRWSILTVVVMEQRPWLWRFIGITYDRSISTKTPF